MASYTRRQVVVKMTEIASANWLLSSGRQRVDASLRLFSPIQQ